MSMEETMKNFMAQITSKLDTNNQLIKSEAEKINTNMNEKLQPLVKEVTEMKQKVQNLEKNIEINMSRINKIEKKRNLIIFGLEQEEEEDPTMLEEKLLQLFKEKLNIKVETFEIDFIKRFGKAKDKKPIVVGLTTWKRKISILTQTPKLKGTNIVIKEDFPKDVIEIRKKLYPQMKTYREQNRKAILKYDKLYVDGKPIVAEEKQEDNMMEYDESADEINQYKKRPASQSPEIIIDKTKKTETPYKKKQTPLSIQLTQSKLTHLITPQSSTKNNEKSQ
ncbi:hypothetical protein M8J76_007424 [Diaphorina citri]|nr:hypothetical protein M8J75_013135 [Diaphorina citri]KAI5726718.1 hypothetical protein M8J76_007424 [Diaphorina citri]